MAWIDEAVWASPAAIEAELSAHRSMEGLAVLVDDADALDEVSRERLQEARQREARLITTEGQWLGTEVQQFEVPPLDDELARTLVKRAVPALTKSLLERVVQATGGRPGELRRVVRALATEAVASASDIEAVLSADSHPRRRAP